MNIARIILSVLLLAMAGGQILSWDAFVEALATYELFGSMVGVTGVVLILSEMVAGTLLLVPGPIRLAGAKVAFATAVAWSLIGFQAFARGLEIPNCGCFGAFLSQSLNWFVIVQDLEFMALGWWVVTKTQLYLDTDPAAKRELANA